MLARTIITGVTTLLVLVALLVLGGESIAPFAIALIIGIDRLLDMLLTAVNIDGDGAVTCVVARTEGALDLEIFHDSNAVLDPAERTAPLDASVEGRP